VGRSMLKCSPGDRALSADQLPVRGKMAKQRRRGRCSRDLQASGGRTRAKPVAGGWSDQEANRRLQVTPESARQAGSGRLALVVALVVPENPQQGRRG